MNRKTAVFTRLGTRQFEVAKCFSPTTHRFQYNSRRDDRRFPLFADDRRIRGFLESSALENTLYYGDPGAPDLRRHGKDDPGAPGLVYLDAPVSKTRPKEPVRWMKHDETNQDYC